jgi:hypothetical protein
VSDILNDILSGTWIGIAIVAAFIAGVRHGSRLRKPEPEPEPVETDEHRIGASIAAAADQLWTNMACTGEGFTHERSLIVSKPGRPALRLTLSSIDPARKERAA